MNYNPHTPFSEQDYHLVKTSAGKSNGQKEVLRYLDEIDFEVIFKYNLLNINFIIFKRIFYNFTFCIKSTSIHLL